MKAKKALLYFLEGLQLLFLVAIIAGNVLASQYSPQISKLLNQKTFDTINVDDDTIDSSYFKRDFKTYKEQINAEKEYALDVQEEGSVLLKNVNLPLAKSGNITLFGSGTSPISTGNNGFVVGGGGSGSISTSGIPSIHEVFESQGYNVNPVVKSFYTTGEGKSKRSTAKGIVGEAPISSMTPSILSSIDSYKDAGIVIIGRTGSEGSDLPLYQYEDSSKSYLELSKNEIDLIDLAIEKCDKVVVLLNTLNTMDISSIVNKNCSIMYIGAGGQNGLNAIPEILNGTRSPSGRLVDTYVKDTLNNVPSLVNQGNFQISNSTNEKANHYYVYAEGIYVGYRYYETRYFDKVTNSGNPGDYVYSDNVIYPFGYGLSYTQFAYSDFTLQDKGDNLLFSVNVKNIGSSTGKNVVELYMQSPHTDYDKENNIEKSAIELIGFKKTVSLASNESDTITLEVSKEVLASYDSKNAKTYIVDAGDYYFTVADDAHKATNNILTTLGYNLTNGMNEVGNNEMVIKYTQNDFDDKTYSSTENDKVTNAFDDADIKSYDNDFNYLSRKDWVNTYPKPYANYNLVASDDMLKKIEIPSYISNDNDQMPTTNAQNAISLIHLRGLEYDNVLWDSLLDELSIEDMWDLCASSNGKSISTINKPGSVEKDGPAGITATLTGGASAFGYAVEALLASTWNVDLATKLGYFIGNDSLLTKVNGWYAPAVNIHRSPFSGRNFEYYSEDPFISSKFASSLIKEAKKFGVITYIKHFALNDQEAYRTNVCTFANEQTIREIYLEAFKASITDSKSLGIMSSYNRIGLTWSGHHKGLLTNVLRNEWGFKGICITDFVTPSSCEDVLAGLQAGQTTWMSSKEAPALTIKNNATLVNDLREATHNILYAVCNSNAMNGITANTKVVNVTPAWVYCLIVFDVLSVIGLGILSFFTIKKLIKLNKSQIVSDILSKKEIIIFTSNTSCSVIGIIIELIGGLIYSPMHGVGINTNLSPLMYIGLALTIIGFISSLVFELIAIKKKKEISLFHIGLMITITILIVAIIFFVGVIVMPAINPSNG